MDESRNNHSGEPTTPATVQRLRITFGKMGSQKYIGHLDLAKTWERILRRADIGLTYSQGFNARPKMQLASALSLGITSECELVDIWLEQPIAPEGLAAKLMAVSPPGLPIYRIEEVPPKSPPLQTLLVSAVYTLTPRDTSDVSSLRQRVHDLLAQASILRTRRDKPYDLRPLILGLEINDEGQIRAELTLEDSRAGRPDELAEALGFTMGDVAIHRVAIRLRETAAPHPSSAA